MLSIFVIISNSIKDWSLHLSLNKYNPLILISNIEIMQLNILSLTNITKLSSSGVIKKYFNNLKISINLTYFSSMIIIFSFVLF